MATLRFRVADADAGTRLDRVVASREEVGGRGAAERLIATGGVVVNGDARAKSYRVVAGDEIDVTLPDAVPMPPSEPPAIPVLWADDHLLVVDKPAGLVVHPGGGVAGATLVDAVAPLGAEGGAPERAGIVHRLDRDTSGTLLVARSAETHEALTAMIRERRVERRYVALVHGRPRSRSGRIEAPIGRDRRDRTRVSLDTDEPRDAVTWFDVRELLGPRALLDVRLETGRTHQIRVHLAAVDLPVCGDPVYGVAGDLGLARQFLHASTLRFDHPVTGASVEVEAPLPPDLAVALVAARAGA